MTQLQESMDKLQENLKLVAERIEKGKRPPAESTYCVWPAIGTYDASYDTSWTWPKYPTAAGSAAKACNSSTTDAADGAICRV